MLHMNAIGLIGKIYNSIGKRKNGRADELPYLARSAFVINCKIPILVLGHLAFGGPVRYEAKIALFGGRTWPNRQLKPII
jgi:hypothetical protein